MLPKLASRILSLSFFPPAPRHFSSNKYLLSWQTKIAMKFFGKEEVKTITERINKLTPDSKPSWGKMNVSQMLEHSARVVKVATGELKLKHSFLGRLFGKFILNKILKNPETTKNSPTSKEFVVQGTPDFETAKTELIKAINKLSEQDNEDFEGKVHPFFGKMTAEEWKLLLQKHIDHHLKQFGV